MSETVEALLGDLIAWLARDARPYAEVMDAWRTSCPRLPVWEDANDRGLIQTQEVNGRSIVRLTQAGKSLLQRHLSHKRESHDGLSRGQAG